VHAPAILTALLTITFLVAHHPPGATKSQIDEIATPRADKRTDAAATYDLHRPRRFILAAGGSRPPPRPPPAPPRPPVRINLRNNESDPTQPERVPGRRLAGPPDAPYWETVFEIPWRGEVLQGPRPTPRSTQGQVDAAKPPVRAQRMPQQGGEPQSNPAIENTLTPRAPAEATRYARPTGATTPAQRASVQGKPCVDCGSTAPTMRADHKDPLVKQHYEGGGIDKAQMRSPDAVQPQCPTCSNRQGADLSRYSREKAKELGLER